jgi:hypothetical protein
MSPTTTPDRNSTRGRGIPRWVLVILSLFVWLVGVSLAHGVLPWALSWLAPRYGWTAGYPGTWNWLGLIPIAAGTAVLIWDFVGAMKPSVQFPAAKPVKTSLNPIRPFRRLVSSCSNSIHPWLKPSSIWMRGSGCFMPCDLKSCSHVWRGTASA